jgi:hypothetical protein
MRVHVLTTMDMQDQRYSGLESPLRAKVRVQAQAWSVSVGTTWSWSLQANKDYTDAKTYGPVNIHL